MDDNSINQEIVDKLKSYIYPIKVDFLVSKDAYSGLFCFSFQGGKFEKKRSLGPYESLPLLRNLLGKCDLISAEVREKLYQASPETICVVYEWDENMRKAMLFNTKDIEYIDEKNFITFFQENGDVVSKWFEHIEEQTLGKNE